MRCRWTYAAWWPRGAAGRRCVITDVLIQMMATLARGLWMKVALVVGRPPRTRLSMAVAAAALLLGLIAVLQRGLFGFHLHKSRGNRTLVFPTYPIDTGPPPDHARVLCWVLTTPSTLPTKGDAVNRTWLRRCDVRLFMSSMLHDDPAVIKITDSEGRENLTTKTMRAFKYVYDHHFNDSEWFFKADDDTYVVMEHLRGLLAQYSPHEPLYLGHHFKMHVLPNGYNSGGAGYLLSRQALHRFGTLGYGDPELCHTSGADEDVEMGRCMQNLGVRVVDTRDERGRNRFHAYSAGMHLGGKMLSDYGQYDRYGDASGISASSPQVITFHYVEPRDMFLMEFFVYNFRARLVDHSSSERRPAASDKPRQPAIGAGKNSSGRAVRAPSDPPPNASLARPTAVRTRKRQAGIVVQPVTSNDG